MNSLELFIKAEWLFAKLLVALAVFALHYILNEIYHQITFVL